MSNVFNLFSYKIFILDYKIQWCNLNNANAKLVLLFNIGIKYKCMIFYHWVGRYFGK